MSDRKLREQLLRLLEKHPRLRRKQLIELCVGAMGYTAEQQCDHCVESPVTHAKSRIGQSLTALIENGAVTEDELGYLHPEFSPGAMLRQDEAADLILACLRDGAVWPKAKLFAEADKRYGGKDTHSIVGQALVRLVREHRIRETETGYAQAPHADYPEGELGYWLLRAENGGDLKECFLGAVHTRGGEWLEYYAVSLFAEYYRQSGKTVTTAHVTGGSNDGGLDGVIETTDWLGFREKTLMQMKNRAQQITPKAVREFCGAMYAEQGTRGIFVTIASFHPEAQRLLDKVDNVTGVDGTKMFEMAKLCRFGIRDKGAKLVLDKELFLADLADDDAN